MATNTAILLTAPDRYALWVDHVGAEVARLRAIDSVSRLCGWTRRVTGSSREDGPVTDARLDGDQRWAALEEPALAMLRELVRWSGDVPLPSPLIGAAEATLPWFGVGTATDGFDPTEAPTSPFLGGGLDPLTALADEQLLDQRSELRVVVRRLVARAGLLDALVAMRSGQEILRASVATFGAPPTAPALDLADTTPRVADVLERTDLCLQLRVDRTPAAIRLNGTRLLLTATAPSRDALAVLRDASLGPALDLLLRSLEDRIERTSCPSRSSDPFLFGR